ncbi:hypothetical protein [Bradyrhizobium sp. LHD-71]|uniref:hypothetical protein n=1 Tax=Bradyrhizobium sp. LHD-71 TaxID=3072141 RepID=UPI0028103F2F|nr:hypothetical protein [Bradyrhizobium sp. LHD-71]MDQ8730262.1 hypothetical protein [Bradyrhizobium sp. LHD-71]
MERKSAADHAGPDFTPPILPQANRTNVIERGLPARDGDGDHIAVQVERVVNRFIDGDTITVCFGGRMRQHIVDARADPPPHIPYTFRFAADDLPDGRYGVYYRVQERSCFGGLSCTSPSVSVLVVNCAGRTDMRLGEIDLQRTL